MVLVAWIQACVPKLSIESSMFISCFFFHPHFIHQPFTSSTNHSALGSPDRSTSRVILRILSDATPRHLTGAGVSGRFWDAKVVKIQPQDSRLNMG